MEAADVKAGIEEAKAEETKTAVRRPPPPKKPKKSTKHRRPVMSKVSSKKVGTAVSVAVMDQIRRLRAKLELSSGKRTTISDAVGYAVAKALK